MKLIKTEMTPRERIVTYEKGGTVDRIPTFLSANETIPLMYGYSMKDFYFDSKVMFEVESRMAEDFEADNMGVIVGLRAVAEAVGTTLRYSDDDLSYLHEPALKLITEVDTLEPVNIDKDGRFPIICEAYDRLRDRYGISRFFITDMAGPLTTACAIVGMEWFLRATIKDEENARKLMQYATDTIISICTELNRRFGVDFMLSEPMASAHVLSKSHFNEFFLPFLEQVIEGISKFQKKTHLHICGKTKDRWQEVVDSGIDSFWVDNCESLKDLKQMYGDRIEICGNVPPVDVLKNGTYDDIRNTVKQCLLDAGDSPRGYFMSPGCSVPLKTPRDNLIAYMNSAAELGRNAKMGCYPEGLLKSL